MSAVIALGWCLGTGVALGQAKDADREKSITALVRQGKLDEAADACRAWLKAEPQAARPHLTLGDVYARQKVWEKAQAEFQTALDLDPGLAVAHARLGDAWALQGKADEAKREYAEALKVSDKCLEAYVGLARLDTEAKKPDEAQVYLDMALQIAPDDASVLALAGEMQRAAGKLPEAEALLTKALQKDPGNADALFGLGACLQAEGKEAEAQPYWDRFLAAEAGTERAWLAQWGLVEIAVREVGGSGGTDQRPVFSPDGKTLAFCAHAAGTPWEARTWEVWTMPADGSKPAQCITTGGGAMFARWTLDGKSILFEFFLEEKSDQKKIFVVPLAGGEPKCISPGLGCAADPIPGTDRVCYSEGSQLFSVKLDGTDSRLLTAKPPASWSTYTTSVSPDGTSIAMSATCFPKSGAAECQLLIAPLEGGGPARRVATPDSAGRTGPIYPSWGPDGKRLMYSDDLTHPREAHDTYVLILGDPHPPARLVSGGRATWSPDGTKIAYDGWSDKRGTGAIFVLELGGKRLPIVKPPPSTEPAKP